MGVYFTSPNNKVPKIMAWGVDRLDYWSQAYAYCVVNFDNGRLVSVAPEALGALGMDTQAVKTYTTADLEVAKKQFNQVAELVKPESIDKVQSLLTKL
jgi:hypothetical protein